MVGSKKKVTSYEEIRRQRVEENKKRMEDLNLMKLAKHLRPQSNPSPKPSPAKPRPRRPAVLTPARRSTRIADKPSVSYKEGPVEPLGEARRTFSYQRRDLLNRVYASSEVRQYAIYRAEELQSALDPEHPSFVKPMLQSHVTGGFWLGLPVHFCKTYLPKEDEMMTLVDEVEEPFPTKYLAGKTGLSGGWRGFAIDHELVDGDALVFQLVSPTEFKVHIIRANEVGGNSEKENQDEEDEYSEKGNQEEAEDAEKENKNEDEDDTDGTRRRSKRIKTARR